MRYILQGDNGNTIVIDAEGRASLTGDYLTAEANGAADALQGATKAELMAKFYGDQRFSTLHDMNVKSVRVEDKVEKPEGEAQWKG